MKNNCIAVFVHPTAEGLSRYACGGESDCVHNANAPDRCYHHHPDSISKCSCTNAVIGAREANNEK